VNRSPGSNEKVGMKTALLQSDLRDVPTEWLEKEIETRKRRWRQSPSVRGPENERLYCDECAHFNQKQTRCKLGLEIKFRIPESHHDIQAQDWGFFRTKCKQRKETKGS
jgi:hypothetical protein